MGVPRYGDPIEEKTVVEEYRSIDDTLQDIPSGSCKRMVLIDGPNILHSAAPSGRKIIDIKVSSDKLTASAILIIVHKLLSHGFEVLVLMKAFFEETKNSDNQFILEELKRLEVVRFIDDGLDDDSVLLRSAQFYGAAVITRDNFKQITYEKYGEGKGRSIKFRFFRSTLHKNEFHKEENKIEMFTDLRFLRFERAFATPNDADFLKVKTVYNQYEESGTLQHTFQHVDVIADFMQLEMTKSVLCKSRPLAYFDVNKDCPIKFEEFKFYYTQYIAQKSEATNLIMLKESQS